MVKITSLPPNPCRQEGDHLAVRPESADSPGENRVFPSIMGFCTGGRKYVAANCALVSIVSAGILVGFIATGWNIGRLRHASALEPNATTRLVSTHSAGTVHLDLLAKLMADDRRSRRDDDWLREVRRLPRAPTQSHPLLGRPSPGFTLANHLGQLQKLECLLERGPIALVFYLGGACQACMHDLLELNADLDRFHALGAEIVGISGDPSSQTRRRFDQTGALQFPVLSDPGHTVAQAYGAIQPGATANADEPRHAIFLVAPDGSVKWAYSGDTPFRNNNALLAELARSAREED